MTTESPMRLVESTGAIKWPASKDTGTYTSLDKFEGKGIGFLLKGHEYQPNRGEVVPNRSGSAPPSMEGSFAAIGNLVAVKNPISNESLENLRETYNSEEQLRTDPSYLAYYCSNVNLNPRLPPPLISRENRRLVRHIGGFGGNRKLTSFDDSSSRSLQLSKGVLSTHKEETEDDRSPQQGDDFAEGNVFLSEQSKLAGRHKSLVDLIQEDFPRTPSPVYNHLLPSSNATEVVEPNGLVKSLHDSSLTTTNLSESNTALVGNAGMCTSLVHVVGSVSNSDSTILPVPRSSSPEETESQQRSRKGKSSTVVTCVEDRDIVSGLPDTNLNNIDSEMKGLSISSLQDNKDQQNRLRHHHWHAQRGATHQPQGPLAQIIPQGINNSYNSTDQFSHSHTKFPLEVQPVLQSSGMAPPLFAGATAYMTSASPIYPNLQSSGVFAPQYSVGGYALNAAILPPFISGYPHCGIPMGFDAPVGHSFSNAFTTGALSGGSIAPGVDFQYPYRFYGQLGLTMQPSFADPSYMQFIQHSPEGPFGASNLYDPLRPRGGIVQSQVEAIDSHRGPFMTAYTSDQKPHYQRSGVPIANVNKGVISSPNYYGSPPNMGVLMQLPAAPLASSVIPGSPVGGMSRTGRRNELRFPSGSSKSAGTSSGWQNQKGSDSCDDSKTFSFLEELKSSKSRKFELSDIAGDIVQFSADQHGSRFIQQKLETCSIEEKSCVFKEVLPHASKLMTDVFGNYVVQKFFEHGSTEERKELADHLAGHMLPLSLQMYGCRVIQKALEVIEVDQKTKLVHELDGNIIKCVRDQNGNHVIQKCIECVPTERIGFIISAFCGQVAALSTHPYGCRVIQRVLEHCTDELQSCIVDEILESSCTLAEDQYGNYVIQHVLERGKCHERSQIINNMAGKVVQMSQHKYASNVVEKCLAHGDAAERDLLIEEIVGQTEGNDNLLIMMKDQFANYVVQKILEMCTDMQREILLSRIRVHLHALKKYTYGKHIVVRFEQLYGEAEDHDLDT